MTVLGMESFFVDFDVIGRKFRVKKDVFDRYPNSELYALAHQKDKCRTPKGVYRLNDNSYFVQRSPDLFQIVLEYCINKKLHLPYQVCHEAVTDEFHFWNIHFNRVCSCCAKEYFEAHHNGDKNNNTETDELNDELKGCQRRQLVWKFLEDFHSSKAAFIFFVISMMMIVLSVLNAILLSIPSLQFCPDSNSSQGALTEDDFDYTNCLGTQIFHSIDIACMLWFTVELVLRFVSCPSLKIFFTRPLIYIDMLTVFPFYVELIIWMINSTSEGIRQLHGILFLLRLLRLIRIFRILKFARYWTSLKVLGRTMKSAKEELFMLFAFLLMALLIFSNFLYQLEKGVENSSFISIPAAFWWCIVTVTTVGYGDMVPQTIGGKIVAGFTCVCGVLLIAFPIAILVEKFTRIYKEEKKTAAVKASMRRHRKNTNLETVSLTCETRNKKSESVNKSHSFNLHDLPSQF